MDFWGTLNLLVRRWYVVLPAFILSMGAAIALYFSSPPTYESQASLVLTAPLTGNTEYRTGFQPDQINPLLNFDNNLNNMASVIVQVMQTPDFANQVGVPPDGRTKLKVNNGSDNPELLIDGPFVIVAGESGSPETARQIVERAVAGAHRELQAIQTEAGAPRSTFITFTGVSSASPPRELRGNRARPAAAALGVGLVAGLAAAFATESTVLARRRRNLATASSGEPADSAHSSDGADEHAVHDRAAEARPAEQTRMPATDGVPAASTDGAAPDGSAEGPSTGSAPVLVSRSDDRD